jgi:flagellar basal body-associated protein FliL
MYYMSITIDIASLVTIIAAILGCFAWVINKLDKIRDAIAALDKSSVTHEVCSARREKCPCVKELEEIKKNLKEGKHD